ncbi:MAG: hypothetical protein ABI690_09055 [Chloroflexota bacterium]
MRLSEMTLCRLNRPSQAFDIRHKPAHRVALAGLISEYDLQQRAEVGFAQIRRRRFQRLNRR